MYVIDHMNGMYEFYRGNQLVYRGLLHNVYIRLRRKSTGGGEEFYDIVFSGFKVRNCVREHLKSSVLPKYDILDHVP